MEKRFRFIKISENKIFITPSDSILFQQTNFPKSSFGFRTNKEVYWQVELKNYNEDSNSVDINVINYHPSNIENFYKQTQKKSVQFLNFEKLEWRELEPLLSWYKEIEFEHLTNNNSLSEHLSRINSVNTETLDSTLVENHVKIRTKNDISTNNSIQPKDTLWEHQLSFKCYFKDAKFNDGFVSFEKYVDTFNQYLEFKIYNNDILAEYDYIKFYFPKVFNNRKKFTVNATVKFKGNNVIEVTCSSKEIESINEKLIDKIKKHKIRKITNLHLNDKPEKNLFTVDDINSQINDFNNEGDITNNELGIIQLILSQKQIRNKKQLEYLSGLKHNPIEKILFTLKPLFGFLFFIAGKNKNHYCWELLDSHATYIWSIDKLDSPKNQITRIEESISVIKNIGRNNYKANYTKNTIDSDISFHTINHSESNDKSGFIEWKSRINDLLT